MNPGPSADEIADVVLKQFDELPAKRKQQKRADGVREWVPLSGIVAYGEGLELTCLALATGMKCLPHSKLPLAQGIILHDWHAEILCIRSFNHFLLQECLSLLSNPSIPSPILRFRQNQTQNHDESSSGTTENDSDPTITQPFELSPTLKLYLYCSEAPCGDASMELTMAQQEDATPWELPAALPSPSQSPDLSSSPLPQQQPTLPGRANFQLLGHTRRKPSRPDAPPTLSKSCSDKLASMQCTSVLSSITSLFISPKHAYLSEIIVPESQYTESGFRRCFDERLSGMKGKGWNGGYRWRGVGIGRTGREFGFSRRGDVGAGQGEGGGAFETGGGKWVSSNISVSWVRGDGKTGGETLVGGFLQGRKAGDVRGASRVCRKRVWGLGVAVVKKLGGLIGVIGQNQLAEGGLVERIRQGLMAESYKDLKASEILEYRRQVKEQVRSFLGGWVRNEGDDGFGGWDDGK